MKDYYRKFIIVTLSLIAILLLALGLPASQKNSKNFGKNIPAFPSEINKINSIDAQLDLKHSLELPSGYHNYQIFLGKDLENLALKVKAAKEFRTRAGPLSSKLSNDSKKAYVDKSTGKTGYFIVKSSGDLFLNIARTKNSYSQNSAQNISKTIHYFQNFSQNPRACLVLIRKQASSFLTLRSLKTLG